MHRNYMRRGVSLEVIVEEDDNAEVSLDPVPFHDSTDTSSSPTLSGESDVDNKSSSSTSSSPSSSSTMELENDEREPNHYRINPNATDRLRQEKEKRRKQKEEERWRFLERQRSLSCETLTILDVGEDEFSREQWEVETRDWDSENPNKSTEIEHCISRKKILALRFTEQESQYAQVEFESPPPKRKIKGGEGDDDDEDADESERETHVDDDDNDDADGDDENETDNDEAGVENDRYWWNPEKVCQMDNSNSIAKDSEYKETNVNTIMHKPVLLNGDQEQDSLEDEPIAIETFSSSGSGDDEKEKTPEEINCDIEINQNYRKFDEVNNNNTQIFISSQNDNIRSSPFSCGEDSWITVGELIDGTEEKDQNTEEEEENQPDELKSESPQNVRKEVRFSDKLEFLNDKQAKDLQKVERNKLTSGFNIEHKEIKIIEKSPDTTIKDIKNNSEMLTNTIKDSEVPINTNNDSEVLIDNLVSVKAGKHLFEKPQTNKCVTPLVERLTAVLETPDIMIIEKNDDSQGMETENTAEVLNEEEDSALQMNKTRKNTKIRPEELPPPRTVASVRKLFEQLPTLTVCNINQYKQSSTRFDHVRSNPTSKILRFDRHDANHSSKSPERIKPLSSIKTKNSNPKPSSSPSTIIPQIPKEIHNSFPSCEEIREKTRRRNQNWLPPKPPSDDFSATGVPLRKPQVANGFNVQKALRENPRYFHIRVDQKGKLIKEGEIKKVTSSISQAKQKNNHEKGKKVTKTYSYLEAKHQRHTGNTTSLRWIKETVDRSDSESMSSESSEDSGVSRDFSSTIISSFTTSAKKKTSKRKEPIIQQEFLSDPSYKWIDPTILAKIRARGTTVIYFGPRHRPPQNQGNRNRPIRESPDYKLPAFEEEDLQSIEETSTDISKDVTFVDKRTKEKSNWKINEEKDDGNGNILTLNEAYSQTIISTNTNSNYNSNIKLEQTSRPKIIGVKHKRPPPQETTETISSDSTNNNKDDNGQKQKFQPKPFLHTDSRIIHMRELQKKSTAANSVIYDFTEKEA